jgi:phosphatidate cytidylyltransferase
VRLLAAPRQRAAARALSRADNAAPLFHSRDPMPSLPSWFHPLWFTPTLAIALGWCLLPLAVAQCVVVLHPGLRPRARVRHAIQSWWPVIATMAAGTIVAPPLTLLVFAAAGWGLVREALRLTSLDEGERRAVVPVADAAALAVPLLAALRLELALALLMLLLYVGLPTLQAARGERGLRPSAIAQAQAAIAMTCGLLAFLPALVFHGDGHDPTRGPALGFTCCMFVVFSDAMQWLGGKLAGRHPLAPVASPNKTVEGALTGLCVCALVGAVAVPRLLARPAWEGALLGIACCAIGIAGDLAASRWKREAGVKDSGALLPGQGGLLDRCDSLLFVAPCFWLYAQCRT